MTHPRWRRNRPRARTRPAPDAGAQARADWFRQLRAADYDGTTIPLSALRGQPHYPAALPAPVPDQHRQPVRLAGRQAAWVMELNPDGGAPTPQALEVVRFLRDKVRILRRRGQLDRISDARLAMLPAMRMANKHTTARGIVDEAAVLLRCGGDPR